MTVIKSYLVTLIAVLSLSVQAQSTLDSLKSLKVELQFLQQQLKDSISSIDVQINYYISKADLSGAPFCMTTTMMNLGVRDQPNLYANKIAKLNRLDSVSVIEYRDSHWKISKDSIVGWVSADILKETQEMYSERYSGREKRILDTYGQINGKSILKGQIWIGITAMMARESIGNPNKINRRVNKNGTSEQWVYHNRYLYFDNGRLTSYTN